MSVRKKQILIALLAGLIWIATFSLLGGDPHASPARYQPSPRLVDRSGACLGPFTRAGKPALAWEAADQPLPFRLEIGLDREMDEPILRIQGPGSGLTLPEGSLPRGHRTFLRLAVGDGAGGWEPWSSPTWIVSDPRYIGLSAVSPHHYPFGKAANPNLLRDGRGRLHLACAPLIDSRRQLCYARSDDEGQSWRILRLTQWKEGLKVANPTLVLGPDGRNLHLAWAEYSRYPGQLVHCVLDVSEEAVLVRPPSRVSDHGTPLCLCSAPGLGVDSRGVVHLTWQTGRSLCGGQVAYANDREGEFQPMLVETEGGRTPSLRIDGQDRLHLAWSGGRYRTSPDGGETWWPRLDQKPRELFPDLAEHGLRPRYANLTLQPSSNRLVAVAAAEELLLPGPDGRRPWPGVLNVHGLWAREVMPDGLGPLEEIHRVTAPVVSRGEAQDDPEGICFLMPPSVAASDDGCLAVVWQETRVDQGQVILRSFGRIGQTGGAWGAIFEIGAEPDSASVSPLLAPTFTDRLDLVWTESGHYDWRRILAEDLTEEDFPWTELYHGIFYSRLDREGRELGLGPEQPVLEQPVPSWSELGRRAAGRPGFMVAGAPSGERLQWAEMEPPRHFPDGREGLPDMVTLPRSAPAAAPPTGEPTWTPTRTPTRTSTPTVTPTPQGTPLILSVAGDAYIYRDTPDQNYGFGDRLLIYWHSGADPDRETYLIFPDPGLEVGASIVHASLQLYSRSSNQFRIQPYLAAGPWAEGSLTWSNAPEPAPLVLPLQEPCGESCWTHLDVSQAVDAWVNQGASNYGFRLAQEGIGGSSLHQFDSREHPSGQAPLLAIHYIPPMATPSPLPTLTPTPEFLTASIETNQRTYQAGDDFQVDFSLENTWPMVMQLRAYVVLEVEGIFLFYPGWSDEVEGFPVSLIPEETHAVRILDFPLPDPLPSGGPYRFWAVGTHRATGFLSTNVAVAEFLFM